MRQRDAGEGLPRVVLVGPPNAGKSSLFNALIGRRQAIVADAPGTTRDYLVATLDLDDLRCEVCDTAGIDASETSEVGRSAQAQRLDAVRRAEVELVCHDATRARVDEVLRPRDSQVERARIHVWTKSDLAHDAPSDGIATSVVTGQGLDGLRAALRASLQQLGPQAGGVRATAARCRGTLDEAAAALARAARLAEASQGEELVAAEVRVALQALGEVAGAVYTEDLLDRVFSRFCIGK
jgi:tRNA modification GTPase